MSTITLSTEADEYQWSPLGTPMATFSTGLVYNEIKHHKQRVSWCSVVWTSRGIPKHNFLTWLMILNRSPTKDRMISWGISTDPLCILCNSSPESRDHLYFECSYSWNLWSELARRTNWIASRNWVIGLRSLQSSTGPKHQRLLILLAWQASIYLLWTERNNRHHRKDFRPFSSLVKQADSLIRNRISSFRNQNPSLSSNMIQAWFAV
ncbi:unnamed protein product [Brassica rapa]|uniref:Reverse transcriptase zinc-binding domain-containing protein n=1 Tax=Brassica campestris TaxID=3711 RepID=A0A3P6AQH2_BRACM|nr:unnamed protein product [Brassica rapa]VDC96146.1 unnamed protein product [Brassica rapa]